MGLNELAGKAITEGKENLAQQQSDASAYSRYENVLGEIKGSGLGETLPWSWGGSRKDQSDTGVPDYGYGYGYGYGGGSSSPSELQKQAAKNLEPLVLYGQESIENKANQMADVYDIANQGNDLLAKFQAGIAERTAGNEWFSRLLKEQSAYKHLRDTLQNAWYGSSMLNFNSDFQRLHDANAVDVLEALESNLADIETDRLYSLQGNINATNENAANTEAALRSNAGDYAAQLNNTHPDIANGKEEGFDAVIDVENRALNLPDWINDSWYEEHKLGPVEIPYVSNRTRPDAATERAMGTPSLKLDGTPNDILFDQWDGMLQSLHTNNSSAANKRYWDTLTRDYGHRVV